MIDRGMVIWHLAGFGLVVMAAMLVANVVLPKLEGGGRVVLFGQIIMGAWFAHVNYYIQSGPFLRDRVMAPFLGKRPPAERLAYTFEVKMWKDPNVRQQLKSVPVLQRVQKGIELANAGIFRLSETQQTRWLLLSGRLFEGSQERDCAALVKGAVTIDMIFRLLNRLSEAEIQEY